ncbi:MAG: hypothetical protein V4503_11620 [Gemmatimonadota bacterium]
MYSTCLFCTRDLGANDVIETLPVGRRIAFDAAQGRLWVVCRHCARWNLVPFDSRLESIDEAERLFEATRTRFSTENIGLARVKEGLELVRIGPALRPEFAAWRYGRRFASRRRRNMLVAGGIGVAVVGAYLGARAALGGGFVWYQGFQFIPRAWNKRRIRVRHQLEGGDVLTLTHHDIHNSFLLTDNANGVRLGVPTRLNAEGAWCRGNEIKELIEFSEVEAGALLTRVLPVISGTAGSSAQVREATEMLSTDPSIMGLANATNPWAWETLTLGKTNPVARLAIEMVSNEDTERRVLEGELALLERQWVEADRLAKISDSLALPDDIDQELDQLKS